MGRSVPFLSKNGWEWVVFLEKWVGIVESGWEWLGVGESGWEWVRVAGSGWEHKSVKAIRDVAFTDTCKHTFILIMLV